MARYKVIGAVPVAGHAPGETFDADYSADAEAALLAGGHLRRVTEKPTRPAKKSESSSRDEITSTTNEDDSGA